MKRERDRVRKKLIGIAIIPQETPNVDLEQLPVMKIYQTEEGQYSFLEREIIDTAFKEILRIEENSKLSSPSMIFLAVEIIPMRERKRRRRRMQN